MRLTDVALGLGLFVLASGPALAQPVSSFDAVARSARMGNTLRIEDRSGIRIDGRVTKITADEISIERWSGTEERFRIGDVQTVSLRRTYAKLGALIGAGIGAAIGIPYISGEHGDADAPVLTGLLGAGAGVVVGGLIPRTKVLYRAAGHPVAFGLAPSASPRRAGLVLTARW